MKSHLKGLALSIFLMMASCTNQEQNTNTRQVQKGATILKSEKYQWLQLTENAPYAKSYNYQLFEKNGFLYAFHADGAWKSKDGKNWENSGLSNMIKNQAFLDYVEFKGALYALGTFEGNIEQFKMSSQIAKTTDYQSWDIIASESNLPKRFFYHPFVFQDKIWIIGGSDAKKSYADAWTSTDAIHWTKAADQLPFGERDSQQFVIFHNKLYMLGEDVWSSEDGIHWEQESKKIAEAIFGYSALVFDHKIWLIGCSRSGKFQSEVLYSVNGKDWTALDAPWSPRGGVAVCMFDNKIYMTGGKYGGQDPGNASETEFVYSNDVWAMEKAQ